MDPNEAVNRPARSVDRVRDIPQHGAIRDQAPLELTDGPDRALPVLVPGGGEPLAIGGFHAAIALPGQRDKTPHTAMFHGHARCRVPALRAGREGQ